MFDATKVTPSNFEGFERCQLRGQAWFAVVMNQDFFIKNSWGTEIEGGPGDVLMISIPRKRGNAIVRTIVDGREYERRWCKVVQNFNEKIEGENQTTAALNETPIPLATEESLSVSDTYNLRNDGFPESIDIRKVGADGNIYDAHYQRVTEPALVAGPSHYKSGELPQKEKEDNGSKSDTGNDTGAHSATNATEKKSRRKPPAKKKASKSHKGKK
jgi:hypothetical protein